MHTENLKYKTLETFIVKHKAGRLSQHSIGNIFFTGNSGGAVDPFLGFGQVNSITMGGILAKCLAEGLYYEDQLKDLIKKLERTRQFREAFDSATNEDYDKLLTLIGLPGYEPFIATSNINVMKYGSFVLKLKDRLNR